jgi:predicted transcriptional regulator
MNTQMKVTTKGKHWARNNAAELRKEIKKAVDNMTPDQLLALYVALEDRKAGRHG